MITHYDLFAGIGGFSLALEEVFDEPIRHIFCEWEAFPTAVLKQHWPDGEFWGDIADLVTDTDQWQSRPRVISKSNEAEQLERGTAYPVPRDVTDTERKRLQRKQPQTEATGRYDQSDRGRRDQKQQGFTIVTGGFPCQPFSHAGRRRGTADDRYQWPNMFAVIRNVKPEWVIAENVRGLVTWNEGLVLETVCADLESEGYEVQPFIIPAVAVGAPHRRDRVWIIGRNTSNAKHDGLDGTKDTQGDTTRSNSDTTRQDELRQSKGADSLRQAPTDTRPQRWSEGSSESIRPARQESERQNRQYPDWSRNWQEVAFATCDDAVDDGLPRLVDGVPYSRAKWRKESLKAYGNGIVSQVAMEIMKAIKLSS